MTRFASFFMTSVAPAAIGVAAVLFGEADDAPGLVMLGMLLVVGSLVFAAKPALRSRSRFVGFILGAVALTVTGSLVAGWLENAF